MTHSDESVFGIATSTEITEDYVDFGTALESLKEGNKIRRNHWREGTSVEMFDAEENSPMTVPYIVINVWDGTVIPWVATQSDILAEDWFII